MTILSYFQQIVQNICSIVFNSQCCYDLLQIGPLLNHQYIFLFYIGSFLHSNIPYRKDTGIPCSDNIAFIIIPNIPYIFRIKVCLFKSSLASLVRYFHFIAFYQINYIAEYQYIPYPQKQT